MIMVTKSTREPHIKGVNQLELTVEVVTKAAPRFIDAKPHHLYMRKWNL
jgi:hypothetical protein